MAVSFWVFIDGRERVINCWSDGTDVSIGMCIATEFHKYIPLRATCS